MPVIKRMVVLLLAHVALAQDKPPTRPVVNPVMGLDAATLLQYMPIMTNHWVENWADTHIIQACKESTIRHGFDPQDMYSFNVHYDDCDPPWIICRHRNAVVSKDDVINLWSRIPLGMRENVRHIGVWPKILNGTAGGSLRGGMDLEIAANEYNIKVLIHETGHAVDINARRADFGSFITQTQLWKDFYSYDTHVVTPYSLSSWVEHFAELMQYAIWDTIVPGGLDKIYPQQRKLVQNQLSAMRGLLQDRLVPRSKPKCTFRFDNSPAVLKRDNHVGSLDGDIPLPDTSLRKFNVTVLPPPHGVEDIIVSDYFDGSAVI